MRHPVPWITQYASPSLIEAIAYRDHPRGDDPRWRESGAPDQDTYAAWCWRWCGIACFRMALLARDGVAPSLYELALGAEEYGAYVDQPGRPRGLIYRPFADYARDKHAMEAAVITELDPARLTAELDAGRLVIASVSSQIRLPETEPTRTGGHLVLVTGHADGLITFHDPAGHTPEAGVATLPIPVFDRFAAHRGVSLQLLPSGTTISHRRPSRPGTKRDLDIGYPHPVRRFECGGEGGHIGQHAGYPSVHTFLTIVSGTSTVYRCRCHGECGSMCGPALIAGLSGESRKRWRGHGCRVCLRRAGEGRPW